VRAQYQRYGAASTGGGCRAGSNVRWTKRQSPLFCSDRSALWHANYLHPPTPKKSGTVNQITQGLDRQSRFILDPADAKKVGHRQSNNSRIRRSITIYTCTRRTPKKSGTASLILESFIWKKSRAPDQEKSGTKIPYSPAQSTRDGFRESIIRLGVKVDNGLEKLNQGLKKAEKVKNSDQTSESNLRARYTLTTARGAR